MDKKTINQLRIVVTATSNGVPYTYSTYPAIQILYN